MGVVSGPAPGGHDSPCSGRRHPCSVSGLLSGALGAALLVSCIVLVAGCTWRMAGVEHYVGPVVFRYRAPDDAAGAVGQVIRVGVSVEGGEQWGISAGVMERLAVAPWIARGDGSEVPAARWTRPLSPFASPPPGRWIVSLLYLRVEAMPRAALVVRKVYGAEMTAGGEAMAASIGWTSRTLIRPPEDAISMIGFDSQRPLDSVFVVWPEVTPAALDAWRALKEARP